MRTPGPLSTQNGPLMNADRSLLDRIHNAARDFGVDPLTDSGDEHPEILDEEDEDVIAEFAGEDADPGVLYAIPSHGEEICGALSQSRDHTIGPLSLGYRMTSDPYA